MKFIRNPGYNDKNKIFPECYDWNETKNQNSLHEPELQIWWLKAIMPTSFGLLKVKVFALPRAMQYKD